MFFLYAVLNLSCCFCHVFHFWEDGLQLLTNLSVLNIQGAQPCAYYAQNGYCRYGVACKYDHPMGALGYSSSALPLSDMPIAPYPLGFSVATLAPSSSSPEYISTKDPSINQVASPVAAPEPVGAVLPKGVFPPDTIMRNQTSTTGVGSSSPGGGR